MNSQKGFVSSVGFRTLEDWRLATCHLTFGAVSSHIVGLRLLP